MSKWLNLWDQLKSVDFWKATLARAIWTIAQTFSGTVGAAAIFSEVDWVIVASASGVAGLLSIAKSIIVGVPEIEPEG